MPNTAMFLRELDELTRRVDVLSKRNEDRIADNEEIKKTIADMKKDSELASKVVGALSQTIRRQV